MPVRGAGIASADIAQAAASRQQNSGTANLGILLIATVHDTGCSPLAPEG
jgi:hypothetical protein